MRPRVICAAFVALLLFGGAPALGQAISGSLFDQTTDRPVEGAVVLLVDLAGTTRGGARTDSLGAWSLRAPTRAGWYSMRVQKPGYATVETAPFQVGPAPVALRLTTRPEIVMLEEVTSQRLAFEAFVSRRERRMGYGIGPDEVAARIARFEPATTGQLVERLLPGMEADRRTGGLLIPRRAGSRGCSPYVVVDGRLHEPRRGWPPPDIDDLVPLWEIRAIEIYNEPWFIPAELALKGTAWWPCGAVLVWTYRAIGEH